MSFNDRVNGKDGRAIPAVQQPHVYDQGKLPCLRKLAVVRLGEGWTLPSLHALDTSNNWANGSAQLSESGRDAYFPQHSLILS